MRSFCGGSDGHVLMMWLCGPRFPQRGRSTAFKPDASGHPGMFPGAGILFADVRFTIMDAAEPASGFVFRI